MENQKSPNQVEVLRSNFATNGKFSRAMFDYQRVDKR